MSVFNICISRSIVYPLEYSAGVMPWVCRLQMCCADVSAESSASIKVKSKVLIAISCGVKAWTGIAYPYNYISF